jgi:serine/threonine-protein kinase
MGVVVAAEHLELREKVAIKFLLDEATADAELSERFLREARAAVKIKSEHVVRVIDVGRLPSGAPYMVMEYLEGEDLSQRLRRGAVPVQDAVDYIIQSCEAMSVAHRSGIVHRDLKPANLFLTKRPDGSAIIKVLDFGISKVTNADGSSLNLTQTQTMMGSPLYMSPEQMRSSKDVDRSTDIWALGVILYELVSGQVPFDGSTFPEVLVKVMGEPAPPLDECCPGLPEGFAAVVERCLCKDRDDRFSSVAALAVALTPFASGRTLGLQGRLQQSMSGPAPAMNEPAAPAGALTATRQEVGVQAAVASGTTGPANTQASGADAGLVGGALSAATNTAWEGHSHTPVAGVPRRRSAGLVWATGVSLVGALGLGGWALAGGLSSETTGSGGGRAAAAASVALTPLSPLADEAKPSPLGVKAPTSEAEVAAQPPDAPKVAPAPAAPQVSQPNPVSAAPAPPPRRRVAKRRVPKKSTAVARPKARAAVAASSATKTVSKPTTKPAPTRRSPSLSIDFK